jgi:hypothetical protein
MINAPMITSTKTERIAPSSSWAVASFMIDFFHITGCDRCRGRRIRAGELDGAGPA